jgi:hypothetical protein
MSELQDQFISNREMNQAERDTWLAQQATWHEIMHELSLPSPCFRTEQRLVSPQVKPATALAEKVWKNRAARYRYEAR